MGCGRNALRLGRPFDEIADLQKAQIFLGIVPFLHRFADDAALGVAHAAALDLPPQNRPSHEGAGIAAGVTDQHPADRLVADAVTGDVRLGFGAIGEQEIAEIMAALDINIEGIRLAMNESFQRNQLRSREEIIVSIQSRPDLARHSRVIIAGLIADAGDQAARRFLAQALDQFLPQGPQRADMHQHHALVIEPDAAMLRRKSQALGEVLHVGNLDLPAPRQLDPAPPCLARRDGFRLARPTLFGRHRLLPFGRLHFGEPMGPFLIFI